MTGQAFRNADGGGIDRTKPLTFTFDGKSYQGHCGDTLASALLANGVRLVGRSFKYHRPRGIFGAGVEEPNALVQLRQGARTEPNIPATRIELYDGLVATSQNRWPSLKFDIGAINAVLHKLFPAGFYYKTFMWPAKLWPMYEHFIRHIAGMGKTPTEPDPDDYAHRFAHCDVLVCGGGPAGLATALVAGRSGARVVLCDENDTFGGALRSQPQTIDSRPAMDWVRDTATELGRLENVTVLNRTTATAYYDHNMVVLDERVADHKIAPENHEPRHRLWQVRAQEVVLTTGAIERPLIFAGNDRPGVMLASAAQTYANQFGVRAGERTVVFTNNSSAYAAAVDLQAAGIEIQAIIDARNEPPAGDLTRAKDAGIGVLTGHAVVAALGNHAVNSVTVMALNEDGADVTGEPHDILCDLVAVSGGWSPSVHLFSQSRGKLRYDDDLTAFVPDRSFQRERSAGAANGSFALSECLSEGFTAGAKAASQAGFEAAAMAAPTCGTEPELRPRALWAVPLPDFLHGKRFLDLQNDVTADDVGLAYREGYRSVEHLKRYTTLGMGTDQGRTSNVNGLALMAGRRCEAIPAVGTTTFRQPFTPIPMGAIAGADSHDHVSPTRLSPLYQWHKDHGAPFTTAAYWMRAQAYPQGGETLEEAYLREAKHVREKVGIVDVSTLGKIDLQGKDAAELLNRVYINGFAKLAVGKCRYGVMLRDDGIVFDDGTVTRIAEHRFLITTTTLHAGAVMTHLEYLAQVEWPELDVRMISVTDDWAGIALAGPRARAVLECVTEGDVSDVALPFMGFQETHIAGAAARLYRISFSGEQAYEINMAPGHALAVWEALLEAGAADDIIPYGSEAMNILRIEKGHVVGGELNGRTTAADLGFGKMMSSQKPFVGHVLAGREGLNGEGRQQLVGLIPVDGRSRIPRGAQIIADTGAKTPIPRLGEVTSQCMSPNLGHPIGLGILANGRARIGDTLQAHSPLTKQSVAVTVTDPIFIDPAGERLRG